MRNAIEKFARSMDAMRQCRTQADKQRYIYQRQRWFLDAVDIYCRATSAFAERCQELELQSAGLLSFREYLGGYTRSGEFKQTVTEARDLMSGLAEVRYCVHIRGSKVRVTRYAEEEDFGADVQKTFAKFKQGAVKDYRIQFRTLGDMDHVEAQILELVAKLYPEVFREPGDFCQHYDLALSTILQVADRLPHTPVRFAFMLAVLGFGTKVGLFPVHTWLPDAHSEAPTPVSALLSGSLLAVSFYAILRYFQIASSTLGSGFPRDVLLAFGVASLLLAALYLLDQRDLKRLLAYSSVEHMGILAIGVSFGAPIALAGVMLHVLAHAAAKGNAFMGAGVFAIKFGSKQISAHRGAMDLLPWSGPLFLLAVLALAAMPPFGIFRSEFQVVAGGLGSHNYAAAAVLIVLITLAFLGLSASATSILFRSRRPAGRQAVPPDVPAAAAAYPVMAGNGHAA